MEQRKEEHASFLQSQAESQAAVQLIEVAMNKLYNPTLYKAPERRDLTEEERIAVNSGAPDPRDAEEAMAANQGIAGTGVTVGFFAQVRAASNAAPPPPPETFGAYKKKSGKSSGVIGLMDMMSGDLKTEMTEAEHAEKIENAKTEQASSTQALATVKEYIAGLHSSCDFLVENYASRKEARTNEVEGLKNAKAVLSGANFS